MVLDIIFQDQKFRKECNDYKKLVRKYGDQRSKLIRRRLDDIQAANTLEDLRRLPQARCHELKENKKGLLALDLIHPYRLIIKPYHDPIPIKPDGGLDWKLVTTILVICVEDYHG